MTGRARAYLRAIKRGEVILGPALLLLMFSAAIVWVGYEPDSREAAGQERAREATIAEAPVPAVAEPPTPAAPLFPELTLPDLPKDQPKAERRPAGIPGLSEMDVVGELQYLQGTNFRCPGGGSAGGGLQKRVCASSSADDSAVLEVTLVENNPSTVLWVRADARDATDEAAAAFLSYVADLSLEDIDPLNADTWVGENISSGGGYSAEGAELRLYGTEGARTLEIVATGLSLDAITEPPNRDAPRSRNRGGA